MSHLSRAINRAFSQLGVYTAGTMLAFLARPSWSGNDANATGQGVINVVRTTDTAKDAIYSEMAAGSTGTTGYPVHAINYAAQGSAIGGACWGVGAGVVGNKRGTGAGAVGNGVFGSAGIDNGNDQTGVYGQYAGTGSGGTGVSAKNESTNVAGGNALFAWRTNSGGGQAGSLLRDGTGDGHGAAITRTGSGNGDGAVIECSTTGSGQAVTGVRKASNGGATYSLGYLGYFDGTMSVGVYGSAPAGGTVQWAGRFDGDVLTTGKCQVGGNVQPTGDNASNNGTASKRWSAVYAVNGVIQTSDETQKKNIGGIPDAWLDAWATVEWQRFRMRGGGKRWHVGVIAQRVRDAFAARGIDAFGIGVLCLDKWTDDKGQPVERYGVRYDEAMALEAALMRRTLRRAGLA